MRMKTAMSGICVDWVAGDRLAMDPRQTAKSNRAAAVVQTAVTIDGGLGLSFVDHSRI